MVLTCTKCPDYKSQSAEYQNKRYGVGKRVHVLKSGGNAVCTICENQRGSTKADAKAVKKKK